jgi:hypothetical protein
LRLSSAIRAAASVDRGTFAVLDDGPSLSDQQFRFGRGELQHIAYAMPRHIDAVQVIGDLPN